MHTLKFRLAEPRDIVELNNLINTAYRVDHEKSWTNEAQIIRGSRIDESQIQQLVNAQHAQKLKCHLLVAELNEQINDDLIGCILIEYQADYAEIGTFCVAVHCQNLGYGKQILKAAEIYAQKFNSEIRYYSMWVLNVRQELIEFYQRQGYELTEEVAEYPSHANVGDPLVDVHLIRLIKRIVVLDSPQ